MQAILVFALTHLVLLLSTISSTAVSVAFPNITAYYGTSLVLTGWVLSIYQLVAACSMILMGKVSDILGRKTTFLICSGLFVTGSLFAALAPNIQLLIAARFLQSLGAGGFVPSTMGLIVELFPNHRRQAVGLNMGINNLGAIIGPNIGGWLVTSFGWQSIFWFNVPIVILAIIPLFLLLKSNKREKVQIDFKGAGFFSAFLFTFMVGLSQLAHSGTGTGWLIIVLLFVASVCFLVMFIRHEVKTRDPIIDLALLRLKPFAASNIFNFLHGFCVMGLSNFIPLYAVSVYSMTTLQSGYILTARSIGTIIALLTSGFFLLKWGYRKPMLLSSIIVSICIFLFAFELSHVRILGTEINPVVLLSVITLIMGLGVGMAAPACGNACLDLMPSRASTIMGVAGMFRMSGGAINIAFTTLILQFMGNLSLGFTVVFIATGLLVLLTIPAIYAMPEKASRPLAGER